MDWYIYIASILILLTTDQLKYVTYKYKCDLQLSNNEITSIYETSSDTLIHAEKKLFKRGLTNLQIRIWLLQIYKNWIFICKIKINITCVNMMSINKYKFI